jgi:hypothetical protein
MVVDGDGAGGHSATIVELTNTGKETCAAPHVLAAKLDVAVEPRSGTYIPIGPTRDARVGPGETLQMVLETNSYCDGGNEGHEPVPVRRATVTLDDRSDVPVELDPPLNAACGVSYSELGSWEY